MSKERLPDRKVNTPTFCPRCKATWKDGNTRCLNDGEKTLILYE